MTLSSGLRLGPYEVTGLLGAGGMGEVYRARDTRLGREVAVKVLPPELSGDRDRLRRFEQEACATSALNHPNVLSIFDVGTHDGVPYIVTELLDGDTLRAVLSRAPLHPARALEVAVEVARGLAAAHEKGIVHRDLKPENLFVTRDGRVKVLDFGLARLTAPSSADDQTVTRTCEGAILGTVGYMAPEQVRGLEVDQRADVFAFGAVLYELVCGRRAFRGASAVETMNAILRDEPTPLAAGALERVVRRCLEKEPPARFASARELLVALETIAASPDLPEEPTLAMPAPPGGSPSRRRFPLAAAGAGALLAAVVAGALAFRGSGPAGAAETRIQSVVVLPLANLTGDAEQEYFADGMTDELINDLSQVESLRVISRTSAMRFKGTRETLPEIAKRLQVQAVVEGAVHRAGGRVRVTAKLVEAATEKSLWAETFERDAGDVSELQSELARAVGERIRTRLTPEERARLARERPPDPRAYEALLKGKHSFRQQTPEGYELAREQFQAAIAADPGYAAAHAWLAQYHLSRAAEGERPPGEAMESARASAQRALALAPDLIDAQMAIAQIRVQYDWDPSGAELESALARRPHLSPEARWMLAFDARLQGRFADAEEQLRSALTEDPLSLQLRLGLGTVLLWAGRPAAAVEEYHRALELDPDAPSTHELLADALAVQGAFAEAASELERALHAADLSDRALSFRRELGAAGWRAAQRGLALRRLADLTELARERYVSPSAFAGLNVLLERRDEAFRWLEKALEERSAWMLALPHDPQFAPLRGDPRFASLCQRVESRRRQRVAKLKAAPNVMPLAMWVLAPESVR